MDYREKLSWLMERFRVTPKELASILNVTPQFVYRMLKGDKRLAREREEVLIQQFNLPPDFFVNDDVKLSSINEEDIFYVLFPHAKDTGITKEQIDEVIKVLGKRTK